MSHCLLLHPLLSRLLILCSSNLHSYPVLLPPLTFLFFKFCCSISGGFVKGPHYRWDHWQLQPLIQVHHPVVIWASDFKAPSHVSLTKTCICRSHVVKPAISQTITKPGFKKFTFGNFFFTCSMTLFKYLNNDAKHSPFFSEEEIFIEGKIDQVLITIIDSVAVQNND